MSKFSAGRIGRETNTHVLVVMGNDKTFLEGNLVFHRKKELKSIYTSIMRRKNQSMEVEPELMQMLESAD